jgi:DNA-binding beta-propeller fold protein YncE
MKTNNRHRILLAAFCILLFPLNASAASSGSSLVAQGAQVLSVVASGHFPMWTVVVPSGSAVRLFHPSALAIDPRGQSASKWMYLADTRNDRIVKLGTGGHILRTWGGRGIGPVQMRGPSGVAVDGQGDVYVADTGNNRITKFGEQGRFLTQWGSTGSGPGQFSIPSAIAVGGSGNVFVADRGNNRIEKFSPSGRFLAAWPVTLLSSPDPQGFGPRGPYLLALDSRGNVYTAVDTGQCSGGHCVMDYIVLESLSPSGKVIRMVVGGNPYGAYFSPGTKGGPWWQIGAMSADSQGHLFLAEWSPQVGATVTQLSSGATRVGEWKLPPPSGGRGWPPQGMALDPRGNVYVADTIANRVLRLTFRP